MSMTRIIRALLAAGLLLVAAPAAVQAEAGPACADIVDGGGGYTTIGYDGPTFEGYLTLGGEPCKAFEYRIVVLDVDGTQLAAGTDYVVDPFGNLLFAVPVPDGPQFVCAYGEVTTNGGHHVFDRGPDAGCTTVELDPDSGGGGSGWR